MIVLKYKEHATIVFDFIKDNKIEFTTVEGKVCTEDALPDLINLNTLCIRRRINIEKIQPILAILGYSEEEIYSD